MPNMSLEKIAMPVQPADERIKNFEEVATGYTAEMAMEEATRCLHCKHKPCVNGCPVNVNIPDFIEKVKDGEFKEEPTIDYSEVNPTVKVDVEDEIKYHLELNKTEYNTENPIQGIEFVLTGTNGLRTECITSINGKLNLRYLEPNIQYTLTETDSLGHYLQEPISFMMVRDSNKELKFNVLSGDLKGLPQIDKSGDVPVVKINLENEKIPTYNFDRKNYLTEKN